MSDQITEQLEPISATELFREFSDFTIAELILEIKEGREALVSEKKSHAVTAFGRSKAETECEDLRARVHKAELALAGETEEEEVE